MARLPKHNKTDAPTYINLGFDGTKFFLRNCKLCIGLVQSLTLGLHFAINLIKLDNV